MIAQRAAAVAIAVGSLVGAGNGIAHARLDDQLSAVDGAGRTLTVQQWDTVVEGVASLDRNPLTREWFYSGKATYAVSGPDAAGFKGKLELGYQVGFPWALGMNVAFTYTTPNVKADKGNPRNAYLRVITPNLFPGVSITSNLSNGPGNQEVSTFSTDVAGADGVVAVSGAHGTVTGVAGGVVLRPFVRLTSNTGATVTTYTHPWNLD
ncbi:MspA family porin [Mycolicibacterium fluoranthenivorans]|uniref:MspA family porin n=1 Tax=Mycolicibacterium fluoranthenivorans TaxID=258505 RepID=A0A7G8P6Z3_9MYCO|nr:MspA family porin [Mycolicibacterium fluoranthenivorans]QNJ90109.1 MspA family porin [Mycolicibacterium fluoranthenivorans]